MLNDGFIDIVSQKEFLNPSHGDPQFNHLPDKEWEHPQGLL